MPPVSPEAKQKAAAYQKAWHKLDKQTYPITFSKLNSVRTARFRANANGIPFDLDPQWARQQPDECALSGIPFRKGEGKLSIYSPSLDRKRPELGYTKDNCRFILAGLNALKGSDTDEDLISVCCAVVERNA